MNLAGKTVSAAALAFLWIGSACRAQDLPKGEELIDKFVQATGGKEAYARLKNRVSRGRVEMPNLRLKGSVTTYQAAPNLMLTEMTLDTVGKYRQGTDGVVAWMTAPPNVVAIKEGKDKTLMLRLAHFNADLDWRKVFKKIECVKEETLEGKAVYKVECTTLDGDVIYKYYDKATSLGVKAEMKWDRIDTTILVSDYRTVDGIRIPHRVVEKVGNNETIVSLDKIEHNVSLPANQFALPAEVKAKLESSK
jgi:hypothetical protein